MHNLDRFLISQCENWLRSLQNCILDTGTLLQDASNAQVATVFPTIAVHTRRRSRTKSAGYSLTDSSGKQSIPTDTDGDVVAI